MGVTPSGFESRSRHLGLADLVFFDELHGALLAGTYLTPDAQRYVATEDGGATWRAFPFPGPVGRIALVSGRAAFAFAGGSSDAGVFLTRDAGETWSQVVLLPGIGSVNEIEVIPRS